MTITEEMFFPTVADALDSDETAEASRKQTPSRLIEIDHIEFYVSNVQQAAHYYRDALGFRPVARAGFETGLRDRVSVALEQRQARILLTSATVPHSDIDEHIRLHGEGVKDIAFRVADVEHVFNEAVRRGAVPLAEPSVLKGDAGRVVRATVAACDGDMVHSLIQRDEYRGRFLPDYAEHDGALPSTPAGLDTIDHVAISVARGELDRWVEFYQNVFGLELCHQEDIATEHSGMNSKVVQNGTGRIKLVMMEPIPGRRRSQIEEYLTAHCGPGAQHTAFSTDNIVETMRVLKSKGIEFLLTPNTYYEALSNRIGEIDEHLPQLRELSILVDREDCGYLMQVFTKPAQSRPTFFWEIIQRKGARGFGSGNIKALFEAIEREQQLRGSL